MITIKRHLRGIKFFHEANELIFEDIEISFPSEGFQFPEHGLFEIEFFPIDEADEELEFHGDHIATVDSIKHIVTTRYSEFAEPQIWRRESWHYNLNSYLPTGRMTIVPSIHVEANLETKENLGLIVGERYLVRLHPSKPLKS